MTGLGNLAAILERFLAMPFLVRQHLLQNELGFSILADGAFW